MYKLQMKSQRIISYLCLAAAALTFIYSLGLSTDVYFLKQILAISENFKGADMYYAMQPFNKEFTKYSLVLIILAVSCLVFNNHTRRRYYIANYITVAISSIANFAVAIWGFINVFNYKNMFLNVDFEELKALVDRVPESVFIRNGLDPENLAGPYSTFWFDICIFVFSVLIIVTLLNIANAVFKTILMKKEKELLMEGEN